MAGLAALFLGLLCTLPVLAKSPDRITVQQARAAQYKLVDTRLSAFYNGWPQPGQRNGGHLPGALNLSASWLDKMDENTWKDWQSNHQLTVETPLVLYGQDEDINRVADYLQKKGYRHVMRLPQMDEIARNTPLVHLQRFQQLVHPQWLADLQSGKPVLARPAGRYVVVEVNYGEPEAYREEGHIPGADYMNTSEIESEPLWNVVSPEKLEAVLLKHNITADTTVILYSREIMAAGRVAHTLLYAGVKDVRILDGGWQAWVDRNQVGEVGDVPPVTAARTFGASIPAHPEIMLNTEQARKLTFRRDASLVSTRSWPEFIGQTSGYTYIEAKGDIPGARWGKLGRDAYHMDDYLNPDGTLRTADDITRMWQEWDILPSQQVAFYCGTGWGAAMAYFYAWTMGWPHIGVYDGGWMEWSTDPANPRAVGVRTVQDMRR